MTDLPLILSLIKVKELNLCCVFVNVTLGFNPCGIGLWMLVFSKASASLPTIGLKRDASVT